MEETVSQKPEDEKLKKSAYSVSTPRNYVQKSNVADIYAQKKHSPVPSVKAPKKTPGVTRVTNSTPMKNLLKSSPSSVSQISTRSAYEKMPTQKAVDANAKVLNSAKKSITSKKDLSATASINSARTQKDSARSQKVVDSARTQKIVDSTRTQKVKDSVKMQKVIDSTRTQKVVDSARNTKALDSARVEKKVIDSERISKTIESSRTQRVANSARMTKVSTDSVRISKTSTDSVKKPRTESTKRQKELPINITVNSPPSKRKLERERYQNETAKSLDRGDFKEVGRQRTKTRTLDETEVKVLKAEVSNNEEMTNLKKRFNAQPKAFYIDLDGDKPKPENDKSSEEEVSYEDDFESYESDFESYHSDQSKVSSDKGSSSDKYSSSDKDGSSDKESSSDKEHSDGHKKDEENMMDSGSFDLRESQRSANRIKPVAMDFILEDSEDTSDDKKSSLPDEGFQEMSSSSAVSSMKTAHADVLDRPLFIDFSKSKENRRKRRRSVQLRQRAKDLLSMITLHEMSYTLYEMKPIPYDLYMATFGRSNYTQIAVQTFDDGINEEIQTEDIIYDCKWTQHPIQFSNNDIYLKPDITQKYSKNNEDYFLRFSFLTEETLDVQENNKINLDKDYKVNPLRIYFEQKDGAGSCEMLPYESYRAKIKNTDFNVTELSKFLKKVERRVSHVLFKNNENLEMSDLDKNSKLPFSKGYISISTKNVSDEKISFLKYNKITDLIFSDNKPNLLMTIHKKSSRGITADKCIICLWDISVARSEPLKIIVAIDNVNIGRFRGGTDGIFVAALEDGSLHLWDLSEKPIWHPGVASEERPTNLVEISSDRMTQTEIDREWNLKNSHVVGCDLPTSTCVLQSCAYTNSAANMNNELVDCIVGLEFTGHTTTVNRDGGRKIVAQVCSLQQMGQLTIWSIVREKTQSASKDVGKAYWSKMMLEKTQTISLIDHLDVNDHLEREITTNFNLNAAKRRISTKKQDKTTIKRQNSRRILDSDRPESATSLKNKTVLPNKNVTQNWESGIVCCDLKIMKWNSLDNYLVAKNCGEVLCCCIRSAEALKINRFCVATDMSSVTCLNVSYHGLPYFLAATDTGTVNLCSMVDSRVLLTLDCRNGPPVESVDKCTSDNKGRYVSSVSLRSPTHSYTSETRKGGNAKISISSVHWSHINPCCIYTVLQDGAVIVWELTYSDICARFVCADSAVACAHSDAVLALLTSEGEVQVHRLSTEQRNVLYLDLFQKYVTLL